MAFDRTHWATCWMVHPDCAAERRRRIDTQEGRTLTSSTSYHRRQFETEMDNPEFAAEYKRALDTHLKVLDTDTPGGYTQSVVDADR